VEEIFFREQISQIYLIDLFTSIYRFISRASAVTSKGKAVKFQKTQLLFFINHEEHEGHKA